MDIYEILRSLPEAERAETAEFLLMLEQMDSDHVTLQLETKKQAEKHAFQRQLLMFILVAIAMLGLIALLVIVLLVYQDTPEIVEKLIYGLGGAILGALGGGLTGFRLGKSKRSE